MRRALLSVAIGLAVLSSSIGGSAVEGPTTDKPSAPGCPACDQMSWSYSGDTGPAEWARICGAPDCSTGKRQSPIAIARARYTSLPRISFHRHSAPLPMLRATNYGATAKTSYDGRPEESYIEFQGSNAKYRFVEVHFHAPAEHTLNGRHYEMEMHLVHVNVANPMDNIAIAVLINEGAPNAAFDNILNTLPSGPRCQERTIPYQNVYDLLPGNRDQYYRYAGSLTTPNCNQTVEFVILNAEITLSKAQIDKFRDFIKGQGFEFDNRPIIDRPAPDLRTNVR